MKVKFKNETQLAEKVVEYLQNLKWDVYQEVQIFSGGSIADIVAIQNKIVWVIECKLSFSLNLIEQAINHKGYANYISVAVPTTIYRKTWRNSRVGQHILEYYGIGCLQVSPHENYYNLGVHESQPPTLYRKALTKYYLNNVCEAHKTFAKAGNAEGNRYTPFKATCDSIKKYLQRNPGCTFKQLIEGINHHYASNSTARGSILQWIDSGVIKFVQLEYIKGKYQLYLKENKKGDL